MSGGRKRGNYEEPFSLDVSFDEALERFAQADPKEAEALDELMKDDATIDGLMKAFEEAAFLSEEDLESVWSARDLMVLFEYEKWQNFREVIARAWEACRQAGIDPANHFARPDFTAPWNPEEVFTAASKNPQGGRPSEDVVLDRYAAYLVAENADSSKRPVAFAQTYFTIQTRRQEIADAEAEALAYDQKRVELRARLKEHNKALAEAASSAGVQTPAQFRNFMGVGLKTLYGGLSLDQILKRKGLPPKANHLDHAGHEELAAHYFKATQTEARLRREGTTGIRKANAVHQEVAQITRDAIARAGNTMPEDIAAEEDIKKVARRLKAAEKAKAAPAAKPTTKKIAAKKPKG